ncbi:unnamed protein product [Adineta steineri]|uniref:Uncharacterized protein n=1 Tax=Adineta steineri TaxID=433720 RepID=A0A813W3L0_9BILA|nr:unnamed protein product [Adineta steineri]CAF1078476.1 unnamed protein product [Adineta steineri]
MFIESSSTAMNNQHPHPGIEPDLTNSMTLVFPDTGEVKHLTYEYYRGSAGQPKTTVHLPTGIVQTGGEPMFPPDFPGGIKECTF